MAFNNQKTPLTFSLEIAAQRKVQDAIALTGRSLPAEVVSVDGTGTIVTVKLLVQTKLFTLSNVQCPVATSQFARAPIGPGVQGVVWSMDTYIGGVTGLGGGNADLSLPGNLSALVFIPVGNTGFSPTDDPDKYVIYGPDGAIIRTESKLTIFDINDQAPTITLPPGVPLRINGGVIIEGGLALGGTITAFDGHSTYPFDFQTAGNVVARAGTPNSVGLDSHGHTQGADSHGDAEEPIGAPTPGT